MCACYGASAKTLSYLVLLGVLGIAFHTDLTRGVVPNALVVVGIVAWLVGFGVEALFLVAVIPSAFEAELNFPDAFFLLGFFAPRMIDGIIGALVTAGGLLVFSIVYEQVVKKSSLGGGDIKLLFVVGLFFGLEAALLNLLLACVIGLCFALLWRWAAQQGSREAWQGHGATQQGSQVGPQDGRESLGVRGAEPSGVRAKLRAYAAYWFPEENILLGPLVETSPTSPAAQSESSQETLKEIPQELPAGALIKPPTPASVFPFAPAIAVSALLLVVLGIPPWL